MTREFINMPIFDKRWKELGFDDEALKELQEYLCEYANIVPIIQGTGGVRKIRWAFEGRGKSGSVRVIFIDFAFYEKIYLLTVYSKDEKDNLSDKEKETLKALVKTLEKALERK